MNANQPSPSLAEKLSRIRLLASDVDGVLADGKIYYTSEVLAANTIQQMEAHAITVLPVLDETQTPCGMIHLHDLVKAGLI